MSFHRTPLGSMFAQAHYAKKVAHQQIKKSGHVIQRKKKKQPIYDPIKYEAGKWREARWQEDGTFLTHYQFVRRARLANARTYNSHPRRSRVPVTLVKI